MTWVEVRPPPETRGGQPSKSVQRLQLARFVSIASFSDEDSQLCARSADDEGELPPASLTAEHVESAQVMDVNGDSMDDLVFHIAKQDCRTLDITTRTEVFVNTGSGFRQLSPAEGIRPDQ
jgi:hypothetical protein